MSRCHGRRAFKRQWRGLTAIAIDCRHHKDTAFESMLRKADFKRSRRTEYILMYSLTSRRLSAMYGDHPPLNNSPT